jgi:uncharacterized delta-60 repeat protein
MWFFSSRKTPNVQRACRVPRSFRPRLEALEDRCLLSAGALDPTFGNGAGYVTTSPSNGNDSAFSALVQPDGKVVAAGTADLVNAKKNVLTAEDFAVARYNTDGTLDASFGSGGQALANFGSVVVSGSGPSYYAQSHAAALYPQAGTANDDKIVLAGEQDVYSKSGVQTNFALARFNTNGTLDSTFGQAGEVTTSFPVGSLGGAHGVVIQPDGKIVAAGGSTTGFELARYYANGTLDTSFGNGGKVVTSLGQTSYVSALLLQPDGKLIVVGYMEPASGDVWELARYNANGTLDTSFGNGGIVSGTFGTGADADAAALYPNGTANAGKIIVAGNVPGGSGLARYNPDGSLDSTFGNGGEVITSASPYPWAVAIAADGKIVVPGNYNTGGFAMARYNPDGSVDSTFGNGGIVSTSIGTRSLATTVALQSNGDFVLAGWASNGTKRNFAVARYLPSEPEIGSFTANPNPVTVGSSVTLTASNITDGNPNSTITQVAFYLDSNNDGTLEPGTDTLLGYATQTSPGVWTLTNSSAFGLTAGTYTLFAQAKDNDGVLGDPDALTLTVQ